MAHYTPPWLRSRSHASMPALTPALTPPLAASRRLLTPPLAACSHASRRLAAYASEPLTWLEAAVFFLFAIRVYPAEAELWVPLATQRWESYLASAAAIDPDGEATRALQAARAARARGSVRVA